MRSARPLHAITVIGLAGAALALASCGGGGGGAPATAAPGGGIAGGAAGSGWQPGVFQPAARFAAQCAAPRTGIDPQTGLPFPDVRGSTLTENQWLRSWSDELYLWYAEIVDADPALFSTSAYFERLKTLATTPSGNPKDRFHFTMPTSEWRALVQSGTSAGYGAEFAVLAGAPPRQIVVAYTQPDSPGASALLGRGAQVVTVDGVDAVNAATQAEVEVLVRGLFPESTGETHVLGIRDLGSTVTRTVSLQSTVIQIEPVQAQRTIDTAAGPVGYFFFTDHIAPAEAELIEAIGALRAGGVVDLVLDLRYNGGGFLDIASELAYMIAGPARAGGQTFEAIRFNDKHPATNPVTGAPLVPVPFHTTARGFSAPPGAALPTLDLPRVFVLTGATTCSASESIINGLTGIGVEVIQIGSTTCGKPYGFYPEDNCGTTYFSIQFQGVNAQGFGEYADGFRPSAAPNSLAATLPGCVVADDFGHELGDEDEARLAAALDYALTGACAAAVGAPNTFATKPAGAPADPVVTKSPWLSNRILER